MINLSVCSVFSEIVEQTQLVEKELIRTLQSLADVRLITVSEVRRTGNLSLITAQSENSERCHVSLSSYVMTLAQLSGRHFD